MNLQMKNGSVIIDGREVKGNDISIDDDQVMIYAVVQSGSFSGRVNVTVEGDVQRLENRSGNVTAQNVGSIKAVSGDINCGNVDGSATTVSGDIECGTVGGNVKTVSGDVNHKQELNNDTMRQLQRNGSYNNDL